MACIVFIMILVGFGCLVFACFCDWLIWVLEVWFLEFVVIWWFRCCLFCCVCAIALLLCFVDCVSVVTLFAVACLWLFCDLVFVD